MTNIIGFKCSPGYIVKFKTRHSVIFEVSHGDASGVPTEVVNEWIDIKLPKLIDGYKPEDIFNGDEFGLFWRLLSNKTYKLKGQTFKCGKKSRERVSVFICANMTGTEKLKPIVIGKALEPRCFRGKPKPVIYRNNMTAWMTTTIWIEFLRKLESKMRLNNRKIVLIVDNCSSHVVIELNYIKLVFLPPNTTSVLQPMDMGVIHSIKSKYRVKFARKLLAILEVKPTVCTKDFELYEAIVMLKQCWNEVTVETITNCFRKSGFNKSLDVSEICEEVIVFEEWDQLNTQLDGGDMTFEDFVNADNCVTTCEPIPETTIESTQTSNDIQSDSDIECIDSEETDEEPIKMIEAINALTILRKYMDQTSDGNDSCHYLIDKIETNIYNKPRKTSQSLITNYFNKN